MKIAFPVYHFLTQKGLAYSKSSSSEACNCWKASCIPSGHPEGTQKEAHRRPLGIQAIPSGVAASRGVPCKKPLAHQRVSRKLNIFVWYLYWFTLIISETLRWKNHLRTFIWMNFNKWKFNLLFTIFQTQKSLSYSTSSFSCSSTVVAQLLQKYLRIVSLHCGWTELTMFHSRC